MKLRLENAHVRAGSSPRCLRLLLVWVALIGVIGLMAAATQPGEGSVTVVHTGDARHSAGERTSSRAVGSASTTTSLDRGTSSDPGDNSSAAGQSTASAPTTATTSTPAASSSTTVVGPPTSQAAPSPGSGSLPPDVVVPPVPALSGRVTDEAGQPVGGVCVSVIDNPQGQITDANGYYSFATLDPPRSAPQWGVAMVDCRHSGPPPSWALAWAAFSTIPATIDLTAKRAAALAGRVLHADGTPFVGACVTGYRTDLFKDGGILIPPMVTGSDGRFGPADLLEPVPYQLFVYLGCSATGFGEQLYTLDKRDLPPYQLERGTITHVDLVMQRCAGFDGDGNCLPPAG